MSGRHEFNQKQNRGMQQVLRKKIDMFLIGSSVVVYALYIYLIYILIDVAKKTLQQVIKLFI